MECSQSRFALERNKAIISLFSAVILGIMGRMAEINWGLCCFAVLPFSARAMLSLTYIVYQIFKDLFAPGTMLFHIYFI